MKITRRYNKSYTVTENTCFRDTRLSYKAIGLFTQLLSLSHMEEWNYSERGLTTLHTDGVDSVRSGLHELEHFGYLLRRKFKQKDGTYDVEYILDELGKIPPQSQTSTENKEQNQSTCLEKPSTEKPVTCLDFPCLEKPCLENPSNNKVSNNKIRNNKVSTKALGENPPEKTEKEKQREKDIAEVIYLFKEANPLYKDFFKNSTERNASNFLLETFSLDTLRERIQHVSSYNKLPYLSSYEKVYKPSDLKKNWQAMEDKLVSLKLTQKTKTKQSFY